MPIITLLVVLAITGISINEAGDIANEAGNNLATIVNEATGDDTAADVPPYVTELYNTPMSPDTPLTSWGEYADVGCMEQSRILDSGFDKLCRQWEESRNTSK